MLSTPLDYRVQVINGLKEENFDYTKEKKENKIGCINSFLYYYNHRSFQRKTLIQICYKKHNFTGLLIKIIITNHLVQA